MTEQTLRAVIGAEAADVLEDARGVLAQVADLAGSLQPGSDLAKNARMVCDHLDEFFLVVVIGEVVGVHIREEHLTDGILDVLSYNPVARMGYMDYTTVDSTYSMNMPKKTPDEE